MCAFSGTSAAAQRYRNYKGLAETVSKRSIVTHVIRAAECGSSVNDTANLEVIQNALDCSATLTRMHYQVMPYLYQITLDAFGAALDST